MVSGCLRVSQKCWKHANGLAMFAYHKMLNTHATAVVRKLSRDTCVLLTVQSKLWIYQSARCHARKDLWMTCGLIAHKCLSMTCGLIIVHKALETTCRLIVCKWLWMTCGSMARKCLTTTCGLIVNKCSGQLAD